MLTLVTKNVAVESKFLCWLDLTTSAFTNDRRGMMAGKITPIISYDMAAGKQERIIPYFEDSPVFADGLTTLVLGHVQPQWCQSWGPGTRCARHNMHPPDNWKPLAAQQNLHYMLANKSHQTFNTAGENKCFNFKYDTLDIRWLFLLRSQAMILTSARELTSHVVSMYGLVHKMMQSIQHIKHYHSFRQWRYMD